MKKQLKFDNNGKFRMLLFGDLHEPCIFDTPNDRARFHDMQLLMETAVKQLKPDLCVLMGDTYTDGNRDPKGNIALITKPITDAGVPFAAVLGNHEHDLGTEEAIVDAYVSNPNCLCFNDDPNITGDMNFNLTIQASDSDKTAFNLWFIDSNNCCEDRNISIYDWVHEDQIAWYERKANELKEQNGGKPVPAILFQHTPVYEERNAYRLAKPWELYPSVKGHGKRSNRRYVGNECVTDGYVGEDPCAPEYNPGQFESWKKTGDVIGAFFGHDHLNDFTCVVDGITLGQCRTAGFRCFTDGARSCVRIVDIDERDLTKLETKVIHYKEFGLKCTCLGPLLRNFNDKQYITFVTTAHVAFAAATAGAVAYGIKKLKKRKK